MEPLDPLLPLDPLEPLSPVEPPEPSPGTSTPGSSGCSLAWFDPVAAAAGFWPVACVASDCWETLCSPAVSVGSAALAVAMVEMLRAVMDAATGRILWVLMICSFVIPFW